MLQRPLVGCILAAWHAAVVVAVSPTYASLDGSGNNPTSGRTDWNAAGQQLRPRHTYYADNVSAINAALPSARAVSAALFAQTPVVYNSQGLAALALDFVTWVGADVFLTAAAAPTDAVGVPVPVCDSVLDTGCTGVQSLSYSRAAFDNRTGTNTTNPRRPLNLQTGWLDASHVYGPSVGRLVPLRQFYRGLLVEDDLNGVPPNSHCVAMDGPGGATTSGGACASQRLMGDRRGNASPGFVALHGLFVLEHNRQAASLLAANPTWGDERLFQEARKRVVGIIQSITYYQLLPLLLGSGAALANYSGYNTSVDARLDTWFAAAGLAAGHSGTSLLTLCVTADGEPCSTGHLLLREVAYSAAYLDWGVGIGDLLRGLVLQAAGAVGTAMVDDARNYHEGITQDLAVVDIMRGRDFGLPPYVHGRKDLGLSVPTSFAGITAEARTQAALSAAYSGRLADVDLLVGALAEPAASGAAVGATLQAILRDGFTRLRDGDRFHFENRALTDASSGRSVRYLSDSDIAAIAGTRLGDVIRRNTDWVTAPANVFITGNVVAPLVAAAALAASSATVSAQPLRAVTVNSFLSMQWQQPAATDAAISITFTFSGVGWFGIGLGSSNMQGGDCWLLRFVNGTGEVRDTRITGYAAPVTDARQDVTLLAASQAAGVTTMTVRRALRTGDANDADIAPGSMPVMFAWHPTSTAFGYHAGFADSTSVTWLPE